MKNVSYILFGDSARAASRKVKVLFGGRPWPGCIYIHSCVCVCPGYRLSTDNILTVDICRRTPLWKVTGSVLCPYLLSITKV